MAFRPEVYLSATPVELDAYREVVRRALIEMGARPVEHRDYSVTYGPLQGALHQAITRCDAVIHLAGWAYGTEPAERTLGSPRRSFAHYEVDVARSLGRQVIAFVASRACSLPAMPSEDEERRELQHRHRDALERDSLPATHFSSADELAKKIRALRTQIMVRRSLARLPRASLGDKFVGRASLMASLRPELIPGSILILHPAAEAAGRAGTGTSTLAMELAWRMHTAGDFPFVFHMPGGPRADLEVALAALARSDSLALLPDDVAGHQVRLESVLEWMRNPAIPGRWLIVLDGVDSAAAWRTARTFLPPLLGRRGAVLVTSRLTAWPGFRAWPVGPFPPEHARDFMLRRVGKIDPSRIRAEYAALDKLDETLGRMPLGLELAAGYLRESGQPPSTFFEEANGDVKGASRRRPPTLSEVLDRSLSDLAAPVRALFRQLSCLAPEPASIPLALFEQRGDWSETRSALALLERRGLLVRDDVGRGLAVHRLTREVALDRLSPVDQATALGAALASVDAALRKPGVGNVRELLVPHCRVLLGQLNGHPLEMNAGPLAHTFAQWLQDCGRPGEAEPFFRRALAIEEKRLGEDHPELRTRVRDLASVLRVLGRTSEEEVLCRRAVAMSEKARGADHPEVAGDLATLAGCLRAANSLRGAEALYRRALEIEEKHAGRSHPRVAIALHRLAGLLEIDRRPMEAEPLYRRALEIDEVAFGPDHPRVALRLHNLATILAATRRKLEAEAALERALQIDRKTFGGGHLEMLLPVRVLANLAEDADRHYDAERLYREALSICEAHFGPDHAEVAVDLTNLAGVLWATQQLEAAEPLYLRAAQIFCAQSPRWRANHPHMKSALANLAGILRARGASEEEVEDWLRSVRPIAPRRERGAWT